MDLLATAGQNSPMTDPKLFAELVRGLRRRHDPSADDADGQFQVDGGGVLTALPTDRPVFVHERGVFHASQYGASGSSAVGGQTRHSDGPEVAQ